MFSDELEHISWEETTARIHAKTDADVRRALSKEHCNVEDFMALISPAAAPYLETMARLSKKYTEARFGKTISMFVPLYITNSCTNSCVYCGFHISNPMPRTILTEEEIVNEYKAIKKLAPFENLLLVTGENPAKAGVPYIARALDLAKPYFSNLKIEVMPLKTEEYATLKENRYLHDGIPLALSPETLLANEIQRQLPPYASFGERRLPAQCHHERPRTGTSHFRHAHLRP